MTVAYLGVGSNLGNRHASIMCAMRRVASLRKTRLLKRSRLIETAPAGGPGRQLPYLNGCLKIRTALPAKELLTELKRIERELGRTKGARWGSRPIDLDILFYGEQIIAQAGLTVPHPRIFERDFVVRPLAEVL